MKQRTLYQVRYYAPGFAIGRGVGHKSRLLPRIAALRVSRRLLRQGHDVMISPVVCKLTQAQVDHLDRRYRRA